jgi:hypothetical protein
MFILAWFHRAYKALRERDLVAGCGPAMSTNVVPAKAGTHTAESIDWWR